MAEDKIYTAEELGKIIIEITEEIIEEGRLRNRLSKKDLFKLNTMTALVLSKLKLWAYKDYGLITNKDRL